MPKDKKPFVPRTERDDPRYQAFDPERARLAKEARAVQLLPEDLTGEYNDKEDVTGGKGDPLVVSQDIEEGKNRLPIRSERKKKSTFITPMQEIFIAVYVATRDRNQAALEAGYSPGCADKMARYLLNGTFYPLVANKIKSLLHKQQEVAVMDGAAVLEYVHTVLQFQPAMWFLPGNDGGWLMDMDDVRVLPARILAIIEHMEMKTTELPDGTKTSKMWVQFVSKTQALRIAARYQLGDLNKDVTPVVQIDWAKLFGRGPVTVNQSININTSSFPPGGVLPQSDDDPIEKKLLQLEATTVKPSTTKGKK